MNTIALGPYVPYWRPLAIAAAVIIAPILFSAFRRKDSYRAQWWLIFSVVLAAWTVAGEYRRAQADELEVVAAPTVSREKTRQRSTVDELTDAIHDRRRITFRYDDAQRIVLPHRVGKSDTGNELLRAWEVKKDGETVNAWRLYILSKIETVYPVPGKPFEVAPDYKTPDKAIPEVYAEIK